MVSALNFLYKLGTEVLRGAFSSIVVIYYLVPLIHLNKHDECCHKFLYTIKQVMRMNKCKVNGYKNFIR